MMNNQLEPTIQAAGSWILNNVANNQPRLNIEMAGHWVFKLEKPNTQLYTNIQPVRCWEFNSIRVCVYSAFFNWIPNTQLARYSVVAGYSPHYIELNYQHRTGWIFLYSCVFGFC